MTASCRVANMDRAAYNEALDILKRRADRTYDPNFKDQAKCAGEDINLFYPDGGKDSLPAKRICKKCPVWIDCLLMSMSTPETTNLGIFGRMGPPTRKYLKRELGIKSEEPFLWWNEYRAGCPVEEGTGTKRGIKRGVTHCPKGHEYTEENTRVGYQNGSPYRQCWTCRRELRKEYKLKQRREAPPEFSYTGAENAPARPTSQDAIRRAMVYGQISSDVVA